jgi:hypothetical protein
MLSVYPPINFWIPEPIFMKLTVYITAPELISVAYYINPSHQPVYPPIISRQGLGKNVTVAKNTMELLDASFSMWSVSSKESRWLVLPRTCYFVCLIPLRQPRYQCDIHNMVTNNNNEAMPKLWLHYNYKCGLTN